MNPKTLVTLVLFTVCSIALTGCGGSSDVASLIEKAESHVDAGEFAAAEIVLKNALREDQKNPQALALVGEIYTKQGRLRDAFQVLTAVKQLNPNDAASLASLASIELAAGMREEALTDARKALELDPSHNEAPILIAELASDAAGAKQTKEWLDSLAPTASIHAAIGSLELKTQNTEAASKRFEQAIEADPNSAMGFAGRFQILLSQKKQEEAMIAFAKAAEVADARSGIRLRYIQYLQQSQGDEAAKAAYDEVLAVAPDYLPALSQAAELAAKMSDPETSKKLVESALKLDPIDPTAMRVKGTLLVLEEKVDEAITQLEKTLELYPEDVKANYQIALAYLAKRDLGKAQSRLARVVQRVPNHLEANALLSTIQVQEEDFSGAIITLEKFLKASPDSLQGYLLLAEVYNRKGDNEAAVAIYNQLEDAQPENPQLDYLSGVAHLQGQNRSGARTAFESALADNPLHLQSVEQLTALDMGENNFDAALARINQTIEASPDTSVLYTIRAQILQSKGDTAGAIESFEKSIELDANNRTARTLYSRLLRSLGDTDEAFAQSQAILESNPEDIGAMTTIASIHEAGNRFGDAVEAYEKMLTINDSYLPALNNLAYLYSTKFDKPERAFELAQKAREQSPTSPYTADTLGWIVYKRADYPWALSLLQDSYNKLKGNAEVAYHLGSAHYQLGHRESAIRILEESIADDSVYDGKETATDLISILKTDTDSSTASSINLLEDHISNNQNDAQAIATLATLHLRNGESSKAEKEFNTSIELSPENVFAKLGLAEILSEDPSNASRVYTMASEAKKFKSEENRAQALQGLSLSQQGKADLARTQLGAVTIEELPASLRERVEAALKN